MRRRGGNPPPAPVGGITRRSRPGPRPRGPPDGQHFAGPEAGSAAGARRPCGDGPVWTLLRSTVAEKRAAVPLPGSLYAAIAAARHAKAAGDQRLFERALADCFAAMLEAIYRPEDGGD